MKYPILAVILVLYHSCNTATFTNEPSSDFKKMEIPLIDSLGTLTVEVPIKYDTSFSWVHYSDCNTCHIQKYRMQTRKTPILQESGMIWDDPTDSVDRFTISHSNYLEYHEDDTTFLLVSHRHYKSNLTFYGKDLRILKDTIEKINGRYFSIFELDYSDSIVKKEVLAITSIEGNDIKFSCELMVSKEDTSAQHFFINSNKLIHSIQIKSVRQKEGR